MLRIVGMLRRLLRKAFLATSPARVMNLASLAQKQYRDASTKASVLVSTENIPTMDTGRLEVVRTRRNSQSAVRAR